MNFSFVLAPHPKIEEIFLSGSDGGTICLWNIKTRQLIKKFLEYSSKKNSAISLLSNE
jgi:WD40 repeat protein